MNKLENVVFVQHQIYDLIYLSMDKNEINLHIFMLFKTN